jgi:uncharacterized membrane protein YdjX (TVP38/TMEM64 family)
LIRMTFFPYGICSYLLGLTTVAYKQFIMGTCAVIVHLCLWLYLGTTLRHFKRFGSTHYESAGTNKLEIVILLVELFVAIAVGGYISYRAKSKLD